jgi:hypothetical protein
VLATSKGFKACEDVFVEADRDRLAAPPTAGTCRGKLVLRWPSRFLQVFFGNLMGIPELTRLFVAHALRHL